jgi:hypothetical protein
VVKHVIYFGTEGVINLNVVNFDGEI